MAVARSWDWRQRQAHGAQGLSGVSPVSWAVSQCLAPSILRLLACRMRVLVDSSWALLGCLGPVWPLSGPL